MFGIDWNMDGEIDITDDFLTMLLLDEEAEEIENDEDYDEQNKGD